MNGLSLINRNCDRRAAIQSASATLVVLQTTQPAIAAYIDPSADLPKITKRVYLDVEIGDTPSKGRLVIGLFGDAVPRLAENFETLCRENAYAGTTFYRVLSDFTIQGGAIGDASGKTGKSAFDGQPFEPDNYNIKHSKAGLVSAVRGIGGAVDSRFFINCVDDAAWADDRYAAFGIVEDGMEFVNEIEKVDVKQPQNTPKVPVKIIASGVL